MNFAEAIQYLIREGKCDNGFRDGEPLSSYKICKMERNTRRRNSRYPGPSMIEKHVVPIWNTPFFMQNYEPWDLEDAYVAMRNQPGDRIFQCHLCYKWLEKNYDMSQETYEVFEKIEAMKAQGGVKWHELMSEWEEIWSNRGILQDQEA